MYFYSDFGKYSKEIIEQVKNLIQEYTDASLAITTDIWSSRSQDSYISLTVHFVDKQFRLHRWTPAVTVFNQSHTGENIQQIRGANFLASRTGDHSPRATLRSYFAYRHSEARFCLWVSNLSRASRNSHLLENEIRVLIFNCYQTIKQ